MFLPAYQPFWLLADMYHLLQSQVIRFGGIHSSNMSFKELWLYSARLLSLYLIEITWWGWTLVVKGIIYS